MDTTERGDREWKQAQRQGDFPDNSSTQKTKGGPKLVLSPKAVTALRPLKDRHQFFYIVRYSLPICCQTWYLRISILIFRYQISYLNNFQSQIVCNVWWNPTQFSNQAWGLLNLKNDAQTESIKLGATPRKPTKCF